MEDPALNCADIPVEIQGMEIFLDMKIFQYLEDQQHTHYIVKPLLYKNNYFNKYMNCVITYLIKSC